GARTPPTRAQPARPARRVRRRDARGDRGHPLVADLLALIAAACFALAATLQQKGALGVGDVSLKHPKSLLKLAGQRMWLYGSGVLLLGYVLQAAALDRGRLSVVQPLLVTTIVFAPPLGDWRTRQRVGRRELAAAGVAAVVLV